MSIRYLLSCLIASLVALTACTDLDVPVTSQYTSYPTSTIAVEAKLADLYFHLRNVMGRRYMEAMCLSSDEMVGISFDGGYYDEGNYAHTSLHNFDSEDPAMGWYKEVEQGIAKINLALVDLDGVADSVLYSVRTLRAYYHFLLLDAYGDIPILDHVPAEVELITRMPRAEVTQFVVDELTEALPYLTREVSTATYGRPTRYMAEALLAKIYLNWPVYTADNVADYEAATAVNPHLNDVIACCDEVIASGKYNLGSMAYRFKFSYDNTARAPEDFIYVLPYDAVTGQGMMYGRPRTYKESKGLNPNYYGSTTSQSFGGNIVMTPECTSLFSLEGDERNLCVLVDTVHIYNATTLLPTETVFVVKGQTIVFTRDITLRTIDNTINVGNDTLSYCQGAHSIKFFVSGSDYDHNRYQSNDLPLLRYADVLLMKAEAILRGGTATRGATALSLFNEIRAYVHAPLLDHTPSLKELLDERGREFFDENWRRNDMIRFGTFEGAFFPHYTDFPDANFDPRHRIFPIPKEMLDLYPHWVQNPGY